MDAVMYGIMDEQGISRVELPAEHIAAVMYVTIMPINTYAACHWAERLTPPALQIALGEDDRTEPITANRLYALVCAMAGKDGLNILRQQYRASMQWAIEQVEIQGDVEPAPKTKRGRGAA